MVTASSDNQTFPHFFFCNILLHGIKYTTYNQKHIKIVQLVKEL